MDWRHTRSLRCAVVLVTLAASCEGSGVETDAGLPDGGSGPPVEVAHVPLAITGPLLDANAEISGMAWHGDDLILLPQYPDFSGSYSPESGFLYTLTKAEILAQLDGDSAPLAPRPIPFSAPGLTIAGFEGFEAIAFDGDTAFVTVEASGVRTNALLLKGTLAPDLSRFDLDVAGRATIGSQSNISNLSDETLLLVGGSVLTVHEANGAAVNPSPVAHRFGHDLVASGTVPFPRVEYRVTDATAIDGASRFWAINYFWTGNTALVPDSDPIAETWGEGPTHASLQTVERLIELQYSGDGITLVDRPPIQLVLSSDDDSRNWEALARLDERGFVLATDKFPGTIIAFVPHQ